MAITLAASRKNNLIVAAAWGFMLLASILPEIIVRELSRARFDIRRPPSYNALITEILTRYGDE